MIKLLGAGGLGLVRGVVRGNDGLVMMIGRGFLGGFRRLCKFSVECGRMVEEGEIGKVGVYLLMRVMG